MIHKDSIALLCSALLCYQFYHYNTELCSLPSLSPPNPPWQVWCRLVTAAYNYFHVTNFFWMFGEGCYLHTAIVLTYSTDKLRKWMFICIGWCKYQDSPPVMPPLSSTSPSSQRAAKKLPGAGG